MSQLAQLNLISAAGREAGAEPAALLDELEELGFRCYHAEPATMILFPRAEILQTSGDDSLNLLLSRSRLPL